MRLRVFALAGLGLLIMFAGGRPASTLACTGCPEPLADVVRDADRVLLGTFLDASETVGYRFSVERVLKGDAPSVVRFPPGSIRAFTVGSRWILVLYPGHTLDTVNAWQVESDGRVISPGPFDAPTTLTGFIAWFEMPGTSTALSVAPPTPPAPLPYLAAATVVGLALGGRRFTLRPSAR